MRTYRIQEVAELTGLATARLRAWERRHEIVRPRRLANRYRAYTSEQVALLRAFAHLTEAGERIGDLTREPVASVIARAEGRVTGGSPLAQLVEAAKQLDRGRLSSLLTEQRRRMDLEEFGRAIVLPFGEVLGDQWAFGKLAIAVEHLASEVVVQLLKHELTSGSSTGPVLLAACLPEEHHEWGFLVTLTSLKIRGWRVRYLGANLPLPEVARAAWTLVPQVVALSAADPANVRARLPELRELLRLVPPGTVVVLGGEGAEVNSSKLRRAGLKVGAAAIPDVGPSLSPYVLSRTA